MSLVQHIESCYDSDMTTPQAKPHIMEELGLADILDLKLARERAGLTQAELAKRSGVARQHISAIEHRRLAMTEDRARKLAPALRLEPLELISGTWIRLLHEQATSNNLAANDIPKLLEQAINLLQSDLPPDYRRDVLAFVRFMWEWLQKGVERAIEREEGKLL